MACGSLSAWPPRLGSALAASASRSKLRKTSGTWPSAWSLQLLSPSRSSWGAPGLQGPCCRSGRARRGSFSPLAGRGKASWSDSGAEQASPCARPALSVAPCPWLLLGLQEPFETERQQPPPCSGQQKPRPPPPSSCLVCQQEQELQLSGSSDLSVARLTRKSRCVARATALRPLTPKAGWRQVPGQWLSWKLAGLARARLQLALDQAALKLQPLQAGQAGLLELERLEPGQSLSWKLPGLAAPGLEQQGPLSQTPVLAKG